MELQGSVTIDAPQERVWQALNDPEVLRQCIPGCEEVRQIAPDEMHARVLLKLGPVRATFVGKVLLTDVRPLHGCTLNFEGSGGSAGFARGSSVIALTPSAQATLLTYTAQASVAGKLGQIGGRLMDASARQLASRFFEAFKAQVGSQAQQADEIALAAGAPDHAGSALVKAGRTSFPILPQVAGMSSNSLGEGWFEKERARLLWFVAGVVATAAGVWMGAHWLR